MTPKHKKTIHKAEEDYLSSLGYLTLLARVKRISDKTFASGRAIYKQSGLDIEPNWYLIFKLVQELERTTLTEIAEKLNFSHPSVISILKKMTQAGYLRTSPNKLDKRSQQIQLTVKAKRRMPEMEKIWNACESAVEGMFSTDKFLNELGLLEKALDKADFETRVKRELEQAE